VETEAYLGIHDPASHAWQGRRHRSYLGIWAAAGTWYVYRSYGMHWCLNLTAPVEADGAAVLIRALRPVSGIEVMRRRRGEVRDRDLTNGPGKLSQALAITGAVDGMRTTRRASLRLLGHQREARGTVVVTPRIGITRAADWPLRFVLDLA
jgi:DNA-3-methyladenine glycosylase